MKEKILRNKYLVAYIICLVVFVGIAVIFFDHTSVTGDGISYVDSMKTLRGAPLPAAKGDADFVMHRILTTFLGLESIIVISLVFGKVTTSWLIFDAILYFLVSIVFFKLLLRMFKSEKTALIGGLFFAANYAMVTAGLGHFMDIGGWTFFIFSIYFLYKYIEASDRKDLVTSALFISVGGFFKENAFFAFIPLFFILLYENRSSLKTFFKKIWAPILIIAIPAIIHHINVFIAFHQNYLFWVKLNQASYHYKSRIVEYIKSFGSLLNFLAPISLFGTFFFLRDFKKDQGKISIKEKIFVVFVLVASIPAVMWPGITQRVLFMVVPGFVMLAGYFIKRYEKYWYLFVPVLIAYILMSFFMDSFVLNFVNLPF